MNPRIYTHLVLFLLLLVMVSFSFLTGPRGDESRMCVEIISSIASDPPVTELFHFPDDAGLPTVDRSDGFPLRHPTRSNGTASVCDPVPGNNSRINGTSVQLIWSVADDPGPGFNFSVFMGTSSETMELLETTANTSLNVPGLKEGTTYHWRVVPMGDGIDRADSPVWRFYVAEPGGGDDNGSSGDRDLMPILLGLGFLVLIPVVFLVMRSGRKSGDEDLPEVEPLEDRAVEAEIIHVPEPGKEKLLDDADYATEGALAVDYAGAAPGGFGGGLIRPGPDPKASFFTLLEAIDILKRRSELNEAFRGIGRDIENGADGDGRELPDLFIPGDDEFIPDRDAGEVLALPAPKILDVSEEQKKLAVDELFLITHSGILVQHYSLHRETGMNEDVLASMMLAVKSFMSDSLSMLDKEGDDDSDVNRIDFGRNSLLMVSGKTLVLVGITTHEDKDEILDALKKGIGVLEERFGELIEDWDGDVSKVDVIEPAMEALVRGEL